MPYVWVEPEVFLKHGRYTVYHVYRHDTGDVPRIYTYTPSACDGGDDSAHGADGCFDVRQVLADLKGRNALPTPEPDVKTEDGQAALVRAAIDIGYFDDWDWDAREDEVLPPRSAPYQTFEYDSAYAGGNYADVGEFVLVPVAWIRATDECEAFHRTTGHDPKHIVRVDYDLVDEHGQPWAIV